jgi:hypothetical protein
MHSRPRRPQRRRNGAAGVPGSSSRSFNALPLLFGSSYIWWPSDDVLKYNGTDGLIHVNRYAWGIFVMLSAGAILITAVTGLRRGRPWAWRAVWYDVPFFAAVALIEPDYFFPVLFAVIVSGALLYARRRSTR